MDRLKAIATFVRIVDAGSLSAAAEATEQSAASVVRALAALERHLGVRLLNRSTRRLALTDEGAEFLAWSRRILSEFEQIEQSFDARQSRPGGLLRMTAPVEFGRRHVAPLVQTFLATHPGMRIELSLLDRMIDLLDEGMDLAIRIGRLPDSTLIATPLGRTRQVVCASPAYLRKSAALESPDDLRHHACIAFAPQGVQWLFVDKGSIVSQAIEARLMTNQVQTARQACERGLGLTRLLHYQVADALGEGRLLRVLQAYEPPDVPIQMVYPHARLMSPRVRRFLDWAGPQLSAAIPDPVDAAPTPEGAAALWRPAAIGQPPARAL